MADFCRQCSLELFNEDFGDLKDLNGPHNTGVICEGCGPTVVNPEGECIFHQWSKLTRMLGRYHPGSAIAEFMYRRYTLNLKGKRKGSKVDLDGRLDLRKLAAKLNEGQ